MSPVGAFFHALGAPFRALLTPDGRRAWALLLMAGCSVTMTAYVTWVLWIVKAKANYAFYLGIAGFIMIAIVTTGFAGLLVKRMLDLDALGIKFKVSDAEIQAIADKVAEAVPPSVVAPAASAVTVNTGSPAPPGETT